MKHLIRTLCAMLAIMEAGALSMSGADCELAKFEIKYHKNWLHFTTYAMETKDKPS